MSTDTDKEPAADSTGGTYVYAVVSGEQAVDYGSIGLDGSPVYRITDEAGGAERLAALASQITRTRVRPERRNVAAHNAVLRRALDGGEPAILPMAFGLIAEDDQSVRILLHKNRAALQEQIARVAGKVEMGLRVLWDVPNLFEYFVNQRPELLKARDAIGDIRQARHADMLTLGQMFERALNEEREHHFRSVEAVLTRNGLQVKQNPPRSEREVLNLACLVPRELQNDFDRIVDEAAASFDSHYTFDISGPWAPHNFITLSLTAAGTSLSAKTSPK